MHEPQLELPHFVSLVNSAPLTVVHRRFLLLLCHITLIQQVLKCTIFFGSSNVISSILSMSVCVS